MKIKKNEHKIAYTIMAFFAIVFCSISSVNHYNFRTYLIDLGLHTNAMYDYRNLRPNYSLLLAPLFGPHNQLKRVITVESKSIVKLLKWMLFIIQV